MKKILLVSLRILQQLKNDKRFLVLSIAAPLLIIFLFKVAFDTLPPQFPAERYILPITALLVHFLGFLLSMLTLVQERVDGTLERMFINGFSRTKIIIGYLLGYLLLITLQSIIAITQTIILFDFSYSGEQIFLILLSVWMLSLASVSLGLFLSSLAKKVAHVIPFVPMVLMPSIFLSGLMVDYSSLPSWAQFIGRLTPLYYANTIIQEVIQQSYEIFSLNFYINYIVLFGLIVLFIILTSLSMR